MPDTLGRRVLWVAAFGVLLANVALHLATFWVDAVDLHALYNWSLVSTGSGFVILFFGFAGLASRQEQLGKDPRQRRAKFTFARLLRPWVVLEVYTYSWFILGLLSGAFEPISTY